MRGKICLDCVSPSEEPAPECAMADEENIFCSRQEMVAEQRMERQGVKKP